MHIYSRGKSLYSLTHSSCWLRVTRRIDNPSNARLSCQAFCTCCCYFANAYTFLALSVVLYISHCTFAFHRNFFSKKSICIQVLPRNPILAGVQANSASNFSFVFCVCYPLLFIPRASLVDVHFFTRFVTACPFNFFIDSCAHCRWFTPFVGDAFRLFLV